MKLHEIDLKHIYDIFTATNSYAEKKIQMQQHPSPIHKNMAATTYLEFILRESKPTQAFESYRHSEINRFLVLFVIIFMKIK